MSSALISHDGTPETGNRRVSTREKLGGFVLVFYERENWGKLVNISTGGMAFEFTCTPTAAHSTTFVIEVLGLGSDLQSPSSIEVEGHLVWTNECDKTVGVQFINLAGTAQQQIDNWLSTPSLPVADDDPGVQERVLTSVKAHLRELLSMPVERPEQVTSSAYRQYLDDSFARLEKLSSAELLEVEASPETKNIEDTKKIEETKSAEITSAFVSEVALPESPSTALDSTYETIGQQPECTPDSTQAPDLQTESPSIEKIAGFELVELPASENPLAARASLVNQDSEIEQATALEPIAEQASFIRATETESVESAAEETLESGFAEPLVSSGHLNDAATESSEAAKSVELLEEEPGFDRGRQLETGQPAGPDEPATNPTVLEALIELERALATVTTDVIPLVPQIQLAAASESPAAASLDITLPAPDASGSLADEGSKAAKSSQPDTEKLTGLVANGASALPLRCSSSQAKNQTKTTKKENDFALAETSATKSHFESPDTSNLQPKASKVGLDRLDRLALFGIVGCFVLLLVLGLGMMLSQANRIAATALFENIRKPFMAKKIVTPVASPAAVGKPFQVKVVDLQNRRRVLNFDTPTVSNEAPASSAAIAEGASNPKNSRTNGSVDSAPHSVSDPNLPKSTAVSASPAKENSQPLADSSDLKPAAASPKDSLNQPTEVAPKTIPAPANETATEPTVQPSHSVVQPNSQPSQTIQSTTQPTVELPSPSAPIVPESSTEVNPTSAFGPVEPAVLISSVKPVYPSEARSRAIEGDVVMDAIIDETGHVGKMKVISGLSYLRAAAMESLRQWKYQPARSRGQAVSSQMLVTIRFRLK